MKKLFSILATAFVLSAIAETTGDTLPENVVRDVVVRQQWPWSTTVTATFRIDGLGATDAVDVSLEGFAGGQAISLPAAAVKGVTRGLVNGTYSLTFDPADVPALVDRKSVASFRVRVTPTRSAIDPSEPLYMIVDLEATEPASAVTYLTRSDILSGRYGTYEGAPSWIAPGSTPELDGCLIWTGVTNDVYKTTKLVLRRVPAGTFMFGSPEDELGRNASREQRHQVTLTEDYWVAVFETTQGQYKLVTGLKEADNQSYRKGNTRPIEKVSYDNIRGTSAGAGWPGNRDEEENVDADSFMGRLRAKTGLRFDLPTEAQWEYACRAGTTSALNSGKNLTDVNTCPNMAELGRYSSNQTDGAGNPSFSHAHTDVGSYRPNAWGLYDMHGNVWEWCLDWQQDALGTASVTDPVGPTSGKSRIRRGGGWDSTAGISRSAFRSGLTSPSCDSGTGFRSVCTAGND